MSKPTAYDWHPADIKAALEKRGWTFARIAREHGYTCVATPCDVLRKPYAIMEQIVAGIIGVRPQDIWPSRYDSNGVTLQPRARMRPQRLGSDRWAVQRHRTLSIS